MRSIIPGHERTLAQKQYDTGIQEYGCSKGGYGTRQNTDAHLTQRISQLMQPMLLWRLNESIGNLCTQERTGVTGRLEVVSGCSVTYMYNIVHTKADQNSDLV